MLGNQQLGANARAPLFRVGRRQTLVRPVFADMIDNDLQNHSYQRQSSS